MNATAEKVRFPAADALGVAQQIVRALAPLCERIEIAGSLRRGRWTVGDIEIVYVPRIEQRPTGLFGFTPVSLADERIEEALAKGTLRKRPKRDGTFTWGELNKLAIHTASKIPVDFFSTTELNWWVSLVVRTGSAGMNVELANTALRAGKSLMAYGCGIKQPDGSVIRAESEQHVFELCGVRYREPNER